MESKPKSIPALISIDSLIYTSIPFHIFMLTSVSFSMCVSLCECWLVLFLFFCSFFILRSHLNPGPSISIQCLFKLIHHKYALDSIGSKPFLFHIFFSLDFNSFCVCVPDPCVFPISTSIPLVCTPLFQFLIDSR